jgi:hypothetical protein
MLTFCKTGVKFGFHRRSGEELSHMRDRRSGGYLAKSSSQEGQEVRRVLLKEQLAGGTGGQEGIAQRAAHRRDMRSGGH